jgi:hypothetical protein
LKDTIDKVLQKATRSRGHTFGLVTLEAGKEITNANFRFHVTRPDHSRYDVSLVGSVPASSTPVAMGVVYARAGLISGLAFAKTQYGNVTEDPFFHQLYDVQTRSLMYIEAGTQSSKPVLSAPCMICGLVLPLRNLTVDHQRPQSGGETEAVLKTFRAFGLTKEGPKGGKGQKILSHITAGTPMGPVLTQPGRAALGGTSVNDRYSLNDAGTILYSFVVEAGEKHLLGSQCMHGLLNLKPACQTCNSARGKDLKFA